MLTNSHNELNIIYRISDNGYDKVKPDYINNYNCLRNAISVFSPDKYKWLIIADNVSKDTKQMINSFLPEDCILNVSFGNGAATFNVALDIVNGYHNNEIVYFIENDYIHRKNANVVLVEGIMTGSEYVSLYDHPDKYMPPSKGGNPFIGENGHESTKIFITKSSHWKVANSTTMTFASKVFNIKNDIATMRKWTSGVHPHDFQMFMELINKGRTLITPIPGYSTHGETKWLSPLIDWESTTIQEN
jgi:hypothetical protein